ncbi:putative non-specific serine/threonine protein kinase [Helianthus annuus]|uniref:Non-specific serine/threonine protein kinase n=1 Tax=Helianthus annuus TaxID=4232 RepID=A0A9K3HMI9_HELAN|nr:putative non-specific serine/threonine protein kinase [Helianthus annuus]KAJ0688480.1 putative non-specific serine/threonine protein kinase [Helianthus annuus]KAJ0874151.1 putative non-specific serine/threonine protein kinase [Helianthus annuus]
MEERRVPKTRLIFGFLGVLYASITSTHAAAHTISANQTLRYNETIVSPQETFELGFFSPPNSMNHYIGIWYKKISNRTVVWVANRDRPLTNTSGELTLTLQGVLVLRDATMGKVVWLSTNSSSKIVRNPIGQLLDTGNFIIHEEDEINQENPIWQSFDLMTDTLLPEMKVGWNLVTRTERHYTSWKSVEDPASGEFSYSIDIRGYPQLILRDGAKIRFRAGPWNGLRFSGAFNLKPNIIYNFTFVLNQREIYYQYNLINSSVYTRLVLKPNGRLERLLWVDSINDWNIILAPESDICDRYEVCGPFGSCNIDNTPVCECLKGFEPKSPDQWRVADWSQGCRRTIPLDCEPGEGFNKYSNLKLPDTRGSWYNQTMSLVECEKICKSNCSCTAYTNSNISGTGSGCLLWYGDLVDIRTVPQNGDTLYIRVPHSEIGRPGNENNSENRSSDEDFELPLFGLSVILEATNNFSLNNKLGEGGFGPVYKVFYDYMTFYVLVSSSSETQDQSERMVL